MMDLSTPACTVGHKLRPAEPESAFDVSAPPPQGILMGRTTTFFLLTAALMLSACDRSFSEVSEATVVVISPDVRIALSENTIDLELQVTAARDVTQVRTGGVEFSQVTNSNRWLASLSLQKGLNQFVIETTVDDGPMGLDTVKVFHLTHSFESATAARIITFVTGGHTTTLLPNGTLVLLGGSARPGGPGAFDAYIWETAFVRFAPARETSFFDRIGHSASLLPDGRILVAGGASFGDISSVSELVEQVEIFDPTTGTFSAIPSSGEPIRRMYHTAVLRHIGTDVYIVLFGGRGDTQYGTNPRLDIRRDMRTFQLRNDSLIALSPAVGPFIEFMAGHTQSALTVEESGRAERFLIAGIKFGATLNAASLTIDFGSLAGIDIAPTTTMNTARLRHSSVTLAPGLVAHFNGRGEFIDDVFQGGELFVEEAGVYFSFPDDLATQLTAAFGQSATLLPDGRVLLIGGFDETGAGLSVVEFVSLDVQ